jgi:hypothetical protein
VTWDVKKFMAEYLEGECDNVRCRNRLQQSIETAEDLRDAQAVLRRVMQVAKNDPGSPVARAIYQDIANYNLGHRDHPAPPLAVETLQLPGDGPANAGAS